MSGHGTEQGGPGAMTARLLRYQSLACEHELCDEHRRPINQRPGDGIGRCDRRIGKGVVMKRNLWTVAAVVIGAGGLVAAVTATPALGVGASGTSVKILSASKGTVLVKNTIKQVLTLKVPAGHWAISGKLWASSASPSSIINTELGCGLVKGPQTLDNSILNIPKVVPENS